VIASKWRKKVMFQYLPFVLIIAGMIMIIVSIIVQDRDAKDIKEKTIREQNREQLSREQQENLLAEKKRELDGMLQDRAEDAIEKVDEQLSRISNEKIISVSEYSEQVLEKINQNHQEVVFLYNMLNEKEEEMKKMMTQLTLPKEQEQTQPIPSIPRKVTMPENDNEDMEMLRGLLYTESEKNRASMQASEYLSTEETIEEQEEKNFRERVLAMYEQGVSVLEISKELNRGQGEVNLIIGLYGKK